MDLRLTVVTLGVDDLVRARAFYEQGLGLQPSAASDEHIRFYNCGSVVLALYPRVALAEDACLPAGRLAPAGSFDGVTLACNCADRAEVDALLARAVAAGARLAKPAQEAFWGGYSGYFEDPEGHLWEAVHAPCFELNDQGGLALPAPI
ncbi:MAG: VOC family protein [Humidesulfovibrio sp.]|nr:VOC family protein [Humidesulfovibrio sp.]